MSTHQVTALLLDLALIIVLAKALGAVATRLDQPAVIGEVLAGILLGPTLFDGWVSQTLFPTDVRPLLTALANVGIAVFMFVVGLELERTLIRGQGRLAITVSLSSMVLPFGLGAGLALLLIQNHPGPEKLGFVLFMGAAMSVTAFPVLARILTDRDMHRTRLGGLALTCAAIGDVLAWVMLAVVVAISGGGDPGQWWRLLLLVPYGALMIWVVRPWLRRLATGSLTVGLLGTVLAGLLLSAGFTEWAGLHLIFGAFLFGVVMPREGAELLREQILDQIGKVTSVLLLPVFFVIAGFKVNLSQVDASGLGELGLILLVAIGGKFLGAFFGARAHRLPTRESVALATLMNTRGLTELIILSVGVQLGLLDDNLYSLMVVMAVITTAMAGPLLRLIYPRRHIEQARAEAVRTDGAVS